MRIIIAAAGTNAKWDNHLGVRSHFVPVRKDVRRRASETEPLLERTLRQVHKRCSDIWIVAPADAPEEYAKVAEKFGARIYLAPPDTRNEFESSRGIWGPEGINYLLLGDVYFTDEAIKTILQTEDDSFLFFGRRAPSRITGTRYGEIFANSWGAHRNVKMEFLTQQVRERQDSGEANPNKHGWTMLRMLQGTPLRSHQVAKPWWVEINDATDDIDFPDDYKRHPATKGL